MNLTFKDFDRLYKLLPRERVPERLAAVLSGRSLEETTELHLESGGTPTSAMAHVMDAIANEAFKSKAKIGAGGSNQLSYPSKLEFKFNREEVISELSDQFILLVLQLKNLRITDAELETAVEAKMDKLDVARANGKLIETPQGTYYIKKD